MYEQVDRLPDWAFVDEELELIAEDVINPDRYSKKSKHIVWYPIYKDNVYTGKAVLLAVESVVDGLEALNKVMEPVGLEVQIGWYGDESVHNNIKIEMLYQVLEKWNYVGDIKFTGSDKVFTYEEWMAKLVD